MTEDQQPVATSRIVLSGIALVVPGALVAVRFAGDAPYAGLGIVEAAIGIALLGYVSLRQRRSR